MIFWYLSHLGGDEWTQGPKVQLYLHIFACMQHQIDQLSDPICAYTECGRVTPQYLPPRRSETNVKKLQKCEINNHKYSKIVDTYSPWLNSITHLPSPLKQDISKATPTHATEKCWSGNESSLCWLVNCLQTKDSWPVNWEREEITTTYEEWISRIISQQLLVLCLSGLCIIKRPVAVCHRAQILTPRSP